MYEMFKSSKKSDELSIGFLRDIETSEDEVPENIRIKGVYQFDILKDVFGLAEHQQIATCGLEFKRTLQNNSAKYVLSHGSGADDAANGAKEKIIQKSDIRCYVPLFTPSFSQQIFC